MTKICIEAADILLKQGIKVRVDHHPCIKPIDKELIIQAAKETGAIMTVENHSIFGGFGSAVAEVIVKNIPILIDMIGFKDNFIETGSLSELLVQYEMTSKDIAKKVNLLLERKRKNFTYNESSCNS